MIFEKVEKFDNLEYAFVSKYTGGYISKNKNIFNYIELNPLNQFILEKTVIGTPIFKLGSGSNKFLILSGIHGNELPPQIANLRLIDEYVGKDINSTIFFIPFASPSTTMKNLREFQFKDLNRSTHLKGSLSNEILNVILDLEIDFVGDFHTTAPNSNPGFEAVFSSKAPTPESFLIGNYISKDVGSQSIAFPQAGATYKGAIEDECNLRGIPAVTCEVLSPFGAVGKGTIERSFFQMKSFLDYFGL